MTRFQLPLPIQIVIDDVGWWCGDNDGARGGPFRSGMPRSHVPADYRAIADLGRRTGTRPVAAFVIGEWDRWNLLKTVPSATWMGADWDNRRWDGPWLDETADILRAAAAHLEPALHGVGHEYWHWDGPRRGAFTRAEWFDSDKAMRPADDVRRHLDVWRILWDRHGLGPPPRVFVPCAFLYRIGLGRAGMAPLLREAGVTAINTPWSILGHDEPLPAPPVLFDDGLAVVDRTHNDIPWRQLGPPADYAVRGPTLGLHWPQVLHADPARNGEAVDGWVRLLRKAAEAPDRMLAPDHACFTDQLLHHAHTTLREERDGALTVDARAFFALPGRGPASTVYLKRDDGAGAPVAVAVSAAAPVRRLPAPAPPDPAYPPGADAAR